jgi:heptosyltransferase-2
MFRLHREIRSRQFDVGLSARWDPRDHFLLAFTGVKERIGFPRVRSRVFLTRSLRRPDTLAHRYEHWRTVGHALGLNISPREDLPVGRAGGDEVLIHTGAGQTVRVWPLERYGTLATRLRESGYRVQIACDPDQHDWWVTAEEREAVAPRTVTQLMTLIDRAGVFIGNDSGPGHLAALAGVPTFTIFGPQVPEWFVPLHPAAQWTDGKACPYKPCSDYCRWPEPLCLTRLSADEVWERVANFARLHFETRQALRPV